MILTPYQMNNKNFQCTNIVIARGFKRSRKKGTSHSFDSSEARVSWKYFDLRKLGTDVMASFCFFNIFCSFCKKGDIDVYVYFRIFGD